jgi:hypothetical protein
MRRFLISSAASIAILCVAADLPATSMRQLSLGELSRGSSSIVLAKVAKTEARFEGREIYTYVSLTVSQGLKGAKKGEILVVRQLGGQVGKLASIVPGMPSFAQGEEVLVFLTPKDKAGYPWVNGLQQGKFSVSTPADGGKKQVRGDTSGLNLIGQGVIKGEVPLDQFIDDVRVELGEPAAISPSGE